jgi:pimeloyl-ACP methyl ester carboxylesterase
VLRRGLIDSGLPAATADRYLTRLREPGALTAALAWYRAIPWSMSTPTRRIRVPTTFIWGREDRYLGRTAAELSGRYVHGPYRFHAVDATHWLPETAAAQTAALILDATTPR